MRSALLILLLIVLGVALALAYRFVRPYLNSAGHVTRLREYLNDPAQHLDWQIQAGTRCGDAPFILPTTGYLGFGYGDSWSLGQRHQGFDIFGPTALGQTLVLAAYDGYLTRLPDWKSTVIIRVPLDPLQPTRQIWNYYTHMADPRGNGFISADFPPGTHEQFVAAGAVLGHQGNYSGNPGGPVGMHLHFSVVKDDGRGNFLNELRLENTLDPSPYLGLSGALGDGWSKPVTCARAAS
jgi:murein DD-endopeptidase MepM/ murein hydrolase activator NlpD